MDEDICQVVIFHLSLSFRISKGHKSGVHSVIDGLKAEIRRVGNKHCAEDQRPYHLVIGTGSSEKTCVEDSHDCD